MHDRDSSYDRKPFFGPRLPDYPALPEVVRVIGGPDSSGVYPCLLQQQVAPLAALRDRDAAYVWEPNAVFLPVAVYLARLVGSYKGLPLLIASAACCGPPQPFPGAGSASPTPTTPSPSPSPSPSASPSTSPGSSSSHSSSSSGSPSPGSSPGASSGGPSGSSSPNVIQTTCCDLPIPINLTVTFTGFITGSFPAAFIPTSPPGTPTWTTGPLGGEICGFTSTINFFCQSNHWFMAVQNVGTGSCVTNNTPAAVENCTPLSIVFNLVGIAGCCAGKNFVATVTV